MSNIFDCANGVENSAGEINRTIQFVLYDDNYLWYHYVFNTIQLISGPIADSAQDCAFS